MVNEMIEYWKERINLQRKINKKKREYTLLMKRDELEMYDKKICEIKNQSETCKVEFGFH